MSQTIESYKNWVIIKMSILDKTLKINFLNKRIKRFIKINKWLILKYQSLTLMHLSHHKSLNNHPLHSKNKPRGIIISMTLKMLMEKLMILINHLKAQSKNLWLIKFFLLIQKKVMALIIKIMKLMIVKEILGMKKSLIKIRENAIFKI